MLLLTLFTVVLTSSVHAKSSIESQLIAKIQDAKNTLSIIEKKVSKKRQTLTSQLTRLEREVGKLREKTAIARRLSDEKMISLSQLEKRLSTWQQQQVFQKNLLHRFSQKNNNFSSLSLSSDVPTQIASVLASTQNINQQFYPKWQEQKVIMPSGEIAQKPTLHIGPVTWYWDEASAQAGFVTTKEHTSLQHDVYLPNSDSIEQLRNASSGYIVFDPTLGRALSREQNSESLIDHVIKGGIWAVPILLFALFALIIAFLKIFQLIRLPKFVPLSSSALQSLLQNKSSKHAENTPIKGMQKALLDITKNNSLSSQREDLLFMKLQDCKKVLESRINAIAITAAVSPLLGLLGTVSGMIETFKMMTLFGSGDPEVVSGGIAQALVTTELGLVVAIPALILNAVLSRKAKSYYADLENFAIFISKSNEENNSPIVTDFSPKNKTLTQEAIA